MAATALPCSAPAKPGAGAIGGVVHAVRVGSGARAQFLVWDVDECVRLRGKGRLAVAPVGLCPLKTASRGKAAAVPLMLTDEELFTAHVNEWLEAVDAATGEPVDVQRHLDDYARSHPRACTQRAVFYDLWRHGYRCTSGLKFGVDYLAYTSDPSMVHADFMVLIMTPGSGGTRRGSSGSASASGGDVCIAPLDLVGRARVATAALKTCVLAWVEEDATSTTRAHAHAPGAAAAAAVVRYEAFKRMGPGGAVFHESSALLAPLREAEAAAHAHRAAHAAATVAGGGGGGGTAALASADARLSRLMAPPGGASGGATTASGGTTAGGSMGALFGGGGALLVDAAAAASVGAGGVGAAADDDDHDDHHMRRGEAPADGDGGDGQGLVMIDASLAAVLAGGGAVGDFNS